MVERSSSNDRALNAAEQELVSQTHPSSLGAMSLRDLQGLGKRLREARDRAKTIERRQKRGVVSAAEDGASSARANVGSEAKTALLVEALRRVAEARRQLRTGTSKAPTQAELSRRAAEMKAGTPGPSRPQPGKTAGQGIVPKVSSRPTVKVAPREIGRVSKATKVAQAKRDH